MVYYMLSVDILLTIYIFPCSYGAWKNTLQLKKNILAYHVLKSINRVFRAKIITN